jgi:hypothetical protein
MKMNKYKRPSSVGTRFIASSFSVVPPYQDAMMNFTDQDRQCHPERSEESDAPQDGDPSLRSG